MTSFVGARRREARRSFVWPFPSSGMEQFGSYFAVGSAGGVAAHESPPSGFAELAAGPLASNPVVFSCELKRMQVFAEARFVWRGMNKGRPGTLFGSTELGILETPWPRGATVDLLAYMILYADIGGTAFVYRDSSKVDTPQDRLRVLRPDYVTIVMGTASGRPVESAAQLDADIIGFIYNPNDGRSAPEPMLAEEVAMWVPGLPDPLARFRGMPWLTPIIREAQADQAASMHKLMFFENGATPQMVMSFGPDITEDEFKAFVAKMDASHKGWRNAYRTLYVGGGATPTVVGKDLSQLDFSNTQGKGETRIAAASGIHPVLIPLSEGMQGSSLNAGNYESARTSTANMTFRPLWHGACSALQTICPPPNSGSHLWIDEEFIPFLQEDSKKAAENEAIKATTITGYVNAGFEWESAVAAVAARDVGLLIHSGLTSVQLQPPMPDGPPIPAMMKPPPGKPPPELPAAGRSESPPFPGDASRWEPGHEFFGNQHVSVSFGASGADKILTDPAMTPYVDGTAQAEQPTEASGIIYHDKALETIARLRGFDGKPTVVSEFSADTKGPVLYRGVSEEKYAKQFRTGKYFAGTGVSGSGTYTTTEAGYAAGHAASDGSGVLTMKLKSDANYIVRKEADKLQAQAYKAAVKSGDPNLATLMSDPGRVAAMHGYDAIRLDRAGGTSGDYYLVLNRTAVEVLKK